MAIKFSNNASTTLASAITAAATSLTVATGTGAEFPTLGASDYFYATIVNATNPDSFEIVKVTARSTDTFTIVRAQEGTTALAWSTGDEIDLRMTTQGFYDALNERLSASTTVTAAQGGTGLASYTAGDLIYASGATALSKLAVGTSKQVLSSSGTAPAWATLDLTYLPDSSFKKSVVAATTASITLSGTQTVDGIALVAGNRVLVKDQSTASQNGIYEVAAGAWTRPADANTTSKIAGALVSVDSGTTNGGFLFDTYFKTTDTLGTSAMSWNKVLDAAGTTYVGTTAISLSRASASQALTGITSIDGSAASWTTGRTISLTGDVTGTSDAFNGTANLSFAATLANSGVTAGTYTKVTVDAKGRVTTGASLASADLPTYTGTITSSQVTTALGYTPYNSTNPNGYITSSGSITGSAATLTTGRTIGMTGDVTWTSGSFNGSANVTGTATLANSGVTAGTYTKVTVDAKGRVTSGGSLASADLPTYTGSITSSQVTTALGYTPYNSTNPAGYITSSGSITGNAATASALSTASGSAPSYAARAWVRFSVASGTPSVQGSGNVSSVSDMGTGYYRVNYTTAMPDTNYAFVGSAKTADSTATSGNNTDVNPFSLTTTSGSFHTSDGGTLRDTTITSVVVLR